MQDIFDELLEEVDSLIETNRETWEQLPNETDEAYEAFLLYCSLPRDKKTYKAAYHLMMEKKGEVPRKHIPGNFTGWTKSFQWKERYQAYEVYLDELSRISSETEALTHIAEFKKQQISLAKVTADTAMLLIEKANKRLEEMDSNEIPASALPNYLNAACKIVEMSSDATSRTLGLDTIMEYLQDDEEDEYFSDDEYFEN